MSEATIDNTAGVATPADPAMDKPLVPQANVFLTLIFITTLTLALNNTIVNAGLPAVTRHFDATPLQSSWILLSFMLLQASTLIFWGSVADLVQQRTMFITGMCVFTTASLLAGLAPNAWVLIGLRASQAIGTGMILSVAATIVMASFPKSMLSKAMGVYLAGFAAGQAAGPLVGGFLATYLGWRSLFWFNVPIALVVICWGWFLLKSLPFKARPDRIRLDPLGSILIFIGLAALEFGFSQIQRNGWTHPTVLGGVGLALCVLPVFIWVENRVERPALDLSLFKNAEFTLALTAAATSNMSKMGAITMALLYFQGIHGQTAWLAGLQVMPMAIVVLFASLLVGRVIRRFSEIDTGVGAAVISAIGLVAMMVAIRFGGPGVSLSVTLATIGLGVGLLAPINSGMVMRAAPKDRAGSVNGARTTMMTVASMSATALGLSLIAGGVSAEAAQNFFSGHASDLTPTDIDQLTNGYLHAYGFLLVMMLVALASSIAFRTIERRRLAAL